MPCNWADQRKRKEAATSKELQEQRESKEKKKRKGQPWRVSDPRTPREFFYTVETGDIHCVYICLDFRVQIKRRNECAALIFLS